MPASQGCRSTLRCRRDNGSPNPLSDTVSPQNGYRSGRPGAARRRFEGSRCNSQGHRLRTGSGDLSCAYGTRPRAAKPCASTLFPGSRRNFFSEYRAVILTELDQPVIDWVQLSTARVFRQWRSIQLMGLPMNCKRPWLSRAHTSSQWFYRFFEKVAL